jgi:hypothetical protein
MPSRSILFAIIAQAMNHSKPAIPSDNHPAATAKCMCPSIVAPKKLQGDPSPPAVCLGLIVGLSAPGRKDQEGVQRERVNSNW